MTIADPTAVAIGDHALASLAVGNEPPILFRWFTRWGNEDADDDR